MTPQQAFRLPHFAQRRQQGQALIYGIFVLMGGLAALLFVFNTGQLTAEKPSSSIRPMPSPTAPP